jgi:CrcB protein
MFFQIIGIAFAGAIGTVARYGVGRIAVGFLGVGFPVGTFIVNLSGAFLFGLIAGLVANEWIGEYWKTILLTGLLGGFTTFSAFAYENQQLLVNQKYLQLAINLLGQNILAILAIIFGLFIANRLCSFVS